MSFHWLPAVCALVACVQTQTQPSTENDLDTAISYVCVHFLQCVNDYVATLGQSIIIPRINNEDTVNTVNTLKPENCTPPCNTTWELCCKLKPIVTAAPPTQPTVPPTQPTVPPTQPTVPPTQPTVPPTQPTVPPTQPTVPVGSCGQRNIGGVSRIVSGPEDEALFGEFPWVMAIFAVKDIQGRPKYMYQGVGSLIDPSVVLTAAHTVEEKAPLGVRAGEWDVLASNEPLQDQTVAVKSIIIHEEYMPGVVYNDLALLFLEKPINLTQHVGIICLPEQDERMDGRTCVVSGWGKDKFGKEGRNKRIMKKVDLPIVPRSQCQQILRNVTFGPNFNLHPTFICAGGVVGKDSCTGDGGAPLACPFPGSPNKYVQGGITSWGIECGTTTPGVYVDVSRYRNWIDNKVTRTKMNMRIN